MKTNTGDMKELAKMVMDDLCEGKIENYGDKYIEDLVEDTGWTAREFSKLCTFVWNGPSHLG